jgi:DNA-directed RNA polymerase sigma subunit (sigma70/sigma32)
MRYGEEPLTLAEAGREMGCTRERVRQIEVEALAKLRRSFLLERCANKKVVRIESDRRSVDDRERCVA